MKFDLSVLTLLVVVVGRGTVWRDDAAARQLFGGWRREHQPDTATVAPSWSPSLTLINLGPLSSIAACLFLLQRVCGSSGVLVRQVKAIVISWPEGRRPLVVEFSVNAARTRLSFLPTLSMEHSAASATPAKAAGWPRYLLSSGLSGSNPKPDSQQVRSSWQ